MQESKIQKRLLLVVSFLIFSSFAYYFARKTPGIIAMAFSIGSLIILPFIDKNTMIKTPATRFL